MEKYPELTELIKSGKFTMADIESALRKMRLKIAELETTHFEDQAEIVKLRRWIERLEDDKTV